MRFTGGIICVSNLKLHTAPLLQALKSRVHYLGIDPTDEEMAALIGSATDGRKEFHPDPDDVRRVLAVLDVNEVPVFFKGNLQWNPWREDFPPISHLALARRRRMAVQQGWTVSRFHAALDGGRDGN